MERCRRTWACALGFIAPALVAPAAAPAAVSVSRADLQPSTTQAAAHPDVTITTGFQYTGDDGLRSVRVVLPQGLIGDPKAATQCNRAAFNNDECPRDSRVGDTDVTATATILLVPTQVTSHGDVYNLQPVGSEPARIGVIVRPEVGGMPPRGDPA